MITPLLADETVQKQGLANLQRGWETAGGQLALTDRRLIFESHASTIDTERAEIPLSDIADVRECWTKFLDLLLLLPSSIAVTTREGKEYRMVVHARQDWIRAIAVQKQGLHTA